MKKNIRTMYAVLIVFGAVVLFVQFAPQAHAASWTYYSSITVTSTPSIASGTNVNFPMLVSSTESYWKSVANGGTIHNLTTAPNGEQEAADLVFATSTANCTAGNYLNFETEAYTSSTGALVDWVNVPSVSTGTVIYACYDAPGVTTDQSHPSSTWNANYLAVYHFPEATSTLNIMDSTAGANTLAITGSPTSTTGIIGQGVDFNGSSSLDSAASALETPASYTVTAWVYDAATSSAYQAPFSIAGGSGLPDLPLILPGNTYASYYVQNMGFSSGSHTIVGNGWNMLTMSLNYTTGQAIEYVDNNVDFTQTATTTLANSRAFYVGAISNTSLTYPFIGSEDEVEVSDIQLSPQWITTEYNNQANPSTFYTVGGEDAFPSSTNVTGYAWGNKMGWVNLGTSMGDLEVYTTTVQGYAWSQNFGWINFGPLPSSTGVVNDGNGNLSGYAWSQGTGYINFQGVTIDQNGVFHGVASGTGAGSLVFDSSTGCTSCEVTTTWMAPAGGASLTVSSVDVNGTNPSTITLTPDTTTNVTIEATITDNTCPEVTGGTTTILFYRSGVSSSSCLAGSGNGVSANLNCYTATAFTASSTCSVGTINTTTTFPIQYFAQGTDGSSNFPNQNWIATVIFTDSAHTTASGDSTHATSSNVISTMTAINITTSSINYGKVAPSSTTGSANQTTVVQNAGNSSTTLQLSGTALVNGSKSIATSSQHYATSTFTFGGNEQLLSGSPAAVSGFLLTSPTSTVNVQSTIFWGLDVPNGSATGTYTGTNTFSAVFSN